jgi:hypothetical protein
LSLFAPILAQLLMYRTEWTKNFSRVEFVTNTKILTSFESIFASNLAFLIRLTIHRSASSGVMFNFSANMLQVKKISLRFELFT